MKPPYPTTSLLLVVLGLPEVELIQKCGIGHSASSGVLGFQSQCRQLQKPITSLLGDTIARLDGVSQTFSQVKVETKHGPRQDSKFV